MEYRYTSDHLRSWKRCSLRYPSNVEPSLSYRCFGPLVALEGTETDCIHARMLQCPVERPVDGHGSVTSVPVLSGIANAQRHVAVMVEEVWRSASPCVGGEHAHSCHPRRRRTIALLVLCGMDFKTAKGQCSSARNWSSHIKFACGRSGFLYRDQTRLNPSKFRRGRLGHKSDHPLRDRIVSSSKMPLQAADRCYLTPSSPFLLFRFKKSVVV
jgi:hypothetical protein